MKKAVITFDFDYLYASTCRASVICVSSFSSGRVISLYNRCSDNTFVMDCRFFCDRQEAIDIIERRVIPSDSEADFLMPCGEIAPAAIICKTICLPEQAYVSDNSLHTGIVANSFLYK